MTMPMNGLAAGETEAASQPSFKPQNKDRMAVAAFQALAPSKGILAVDSSVLAGLSEK